MEDHASIAQIERNHHVPNTMKHSNNKNKSQLLFCEDDGDLLPASLSNLESCPHFFFNM